MPDYGHELQFGTFVTPTNRPAEAPVRLAVLSEQLGLDLVTFQDHPYQPAFLDTWTLLSWVAAKTERIHVSANVLNLPLRPPAVLARAAASLDLLSGGRFELGLGAGGFWDAIEAMGGRRLTPGQGVSALGEAMEVIRGVWAAGERTPLRVNGEFYWVDGAKRGPLPAHDIPIWLGAYKPRMLRLVGTKADGWLPSLGYMQPGDLQAGNRIIDEAAEAAGRNPGEIRRLANINGTFAAQGTGMLHGSAAQWVEQLLPLVLEDGIGTFIVMGDDPAMMQRFAEEVAPALREAVAAERASVGTGGAPVRSTIALAKRRDGIDYDRVPESLSGTAVEPGDFRYPTVRSTYLRAGAPGLVLRPQTTTEVVDALAHARAQPVPLAIRSGGHGISGRSTNDGGIVIDLGALNTIEVVDEPTRRVRIGPGARWMGVAAALDRHGWALSSGDYGGVGVGGLATAGGIGFLAREHGLTIDHQRRVEIVVADGRVLHASETEYPDLFWAVRGAGANFGIVTSFEFEVDEVAEVGWAQLDFDASDTADFLQRWGTAVEASPREVTSFMALLRARRGQPRRGHVSVMVDSGDEATILDRLQSFVDLSPLIDQTVQLTRYANVMANARPDPHDGRGEPNSGSGFVDHLTPAFIGDVETLLDSGEVYFFQIRAVGGKVADVDPAATAFGNRSANFAVAAFGVNTERLSAVWDPLRRHFDGLYLSFESDPRPERVADAFPPATLARLQRLKAEWDPDNVFRDNFNITPHNTVPTSDTEQTQR